MSDEQAKFLSGDLTGHIITMSLTAAVGFIALFIVDLVDMLFISMLGIEELAAAVGFAGTILFVTTSLSIGLGIAGGALVAKALGENEPERARELLTHVLLVGFVFALGVATLIYQNLAEMTALVGATGRAQALAISYLQILVPTMPLLLIGIVASAALRSHGAAKLSMMATLSAGIVNAILDPILIFGLDMGLDGAAWASVAARLAIAAVALWYLVRRYGGLAPLSPKNLWYDLKPIAAIALPAMLANIATPIGGAYVTRAAAEFGEAAVAGMAIIGRVTPVAFALIFAMSGAIGPIIGQNFGAQRHDRVRTAFNRSMILIVIYVFPVVGVLYLSREWIADLFNATGVARDLIFLFCGPLSLAWIFNGIIFVANASFNNLGHPFYSTWINWARNTLGIIPFVYLGAQYWGAAGVLIGQMAGGVFVAIVAYLLAEKVMRKSERDQNCTTDRPDFARHRRSFTILHHRR
ncbi:MATE family efflux transporter [Pelagimonas varians]|uniref:Multidrug-efflux transporter n=1 Tax=Pelagimonas varians TaxID=696760 RepID=A0A238L110_9RHOB|nr:MATE family efflux transporter [Pelagimonas varians]PYG27183.1 putative MATE family efflux protein [Pelagimonas varians]SMX48773.1 Multidrug export protein MepA [Pelagimonas varians]